MSPGGTSFLPFYMYVSYVHLCTDIYICPRRTVVYLLKEQKKQHYSRRVAKRALPPWTDRRFCDVNNHFVSSCSSRYWIDVCADEVSTLADEGHDDMIKQEE